MFGVLFSIRSTSPPFLRDVCEELEGFQVEADGPVSPTYSVVGPSDKPLLKGRRHFYVGYYDGVEIFRYEDSTLARQALFAGIHYGMFGPHGERHAILQASAFTVEGGAVVVYGPRHAERMAAIGDSLGASVIATEFTLVDLEYGEVLVWPFLVTNRPNAMDRRGRQLAPLLASSQVGVPLRCLVRTGRGAVEQRHAVAELMRLSQASCRRHRTFEGLLRLMNTARLVSSWKRRAARVALDVLAGCREIAGRPGSER